VAFSCYALWPKSHATRGLKINILLVRLGNFNLSCPVAALGSRHSNNSVVWRSFFVFVGLSQFVRVTNFVTFSKMHPMFIVEHCFRTQSYEEIKRAFQVHFPGAAVPNKSISTYNENQQPQVSTNILKWIELCVQQGGNTFNKCCNCTSQFEKGLIPFLAKLN
jgi:hypothetical protein